MRVSETCRMLDLRLPPYQYFACLYLESHGFKFCVDFGYDNAVDKARKHWRNRRKR